MRGTQDGVPARSRHRAPASRQPRLAEHINVFPTLAVEIARSIWHVLATGRRRSRWWLRRAAERSAARFAQRAVSLCRTPGQGRTSSLVPRGGHSILTRRAAAGDGLRAKRPTEYRHRAACDPGTAPRWQEVLAPSLTRTPGAHGGHDGRGTASPAMSSMAKFTLRQPRINRKLRRPVKVFVTPIIAMYRKCALNAPAFADISD